MTDLPNNVQARLEASFGAKQVDATDMNYSLRVLHNVEEVEDTKVFDNDENGVFDKVSVECIATMLYEKRDTLTDEDLKDPLRFKRLVRKAWLKFLEDYEGFTANQISSLGNEIDTTYRVFFNIVSNINKQAFERTEINKCSNEHLYNFLKSVDGYDNSQAILDEFNKDLATIEFHDSVDAIKEVARYVTCWKQICTAIIDGVAIETLADHDATETFIKMMGVISNGWYSKRDSGKNISRNLQNVMIQLVGSDFTLQVDTEQLVTLADLFDAEKMHFNKLQDSDNRLREDYRGKKLNLTGRYFTISSIKRNGNVLLDSMERGVNGYSYAGFFTPNEEDAFVETSSDPKHVMEIEPLSGHDRLQLMSNLKSTIDSVVKTSNENAHKLNELWITMNDFYTDIVCRDLWYDKLTYIERRIVNFSTCYLLLECIAPLISYQEARLYNVQKMVEIARLLTNAQK